LRKHPCPICLGDFSKESLIDLNWLKCINCGMRFKISRESSLNLGEITITKENSSSEGKEYSFYR